MPRGDGTGRNGLGPMTGRGLGYCAGYDVPGYVQDDGIGFGRRGFSGRGRGRALGLGLGYRTAAPRGLGFGRRYFDAPPVYQPYDTRTENDVLQAHAAALEQELQAVKSRLNSLSKDTKDEEKTT